MIAAPLKAQFFPRAAQDQVPIPFILLLEVAQPPWRAFASGTRSALADLRERERREGEREIGMICPGACNVTGATGPEKYPADAHDARLPPRDICTFTRSKGFASVGS